MIVGRRRSELALFQALVTGEAAALDELKERLRRCVLWVLNGKPGGRGLWGEVDDIVDEALLRLEQLRPRGFTGNAAQFKSYLYKVVVSAYADAASARRGERSLDEPVPLPDGSDKPLGDVVQDLIERALGIDSAIEHAEERAHALGALGTLDERCRKLLTGFYLEGRPAAELARRESARTNTIEVALSRCRRPLYAAFLATYLQASDAELRRVVERAAVKLAGLARRVFSAWWIENRSLADIGKEVGLSQAETREWLAKAKLETWRLVTGAENG